MGERGAGPAVGLRRRRGGHLATDGPADSGAPQAETLAPSSVAVAPRPAGCGVRCAGPGDCGLVYASVGYMGNGPVRGRENQSAASDAQSPYLGGTTGPTSASRTRVRPQGSPESLCWF